MIILVIKGFIFVPMNPSLSVLEVDVVNGSAVNDDVILKYKYPPSVSGSED